MTQQSIHDRIMSRKTNAEAPATIAAAPSHNWWKKATLSLLGITVLGAAGYGATRYGILDAVLSPPAIADTPQAGANAAESPFRQHAKQARLLACSNVFPGLGALLTDGSQYGVQSIWNNETPDRHAVQALVGMNYATEGYTGIAAGVVVAAPTGSDCEGSMVRVAPFPVPCADMPGRLPQGSKLTNNLAQVSVYELPNNGGNAMLLPSGNSCVVISVASAAGTNGGKQ